MKRFMIGNSPAGRRGVVTVDDALLCERSRSMLLIFPWSDLRAEITALPLLSGIPPLGELIEGLLTPSLLI